MNRDEAIRTLQNFGEGIPGHRNMHDTNPTHDDWHRAVSVLTDIPWEQSGSQVAIPGRHFAHHRDVADHLGLDHPGGPGLAGHAEHSTAVMRAIARKIGP